MNENADMQAKEQTTFEATADLVPEGAVATHAFRVVFFVDDSGEEMYSFGHEGEANFSSWLGALEVLKEDMIADFRGHRVRDEEED